MTLNTSPIKDSVENWETAWSTRNAEAILGLWDRNDINASYLPAERLEPLIGTEAVTDYVTATCSAFDEIQHRVEGPIFRRLSENIGLAFYALAWMFRDHRGPIGGSCRVTSVWRQDQGAWRLFHYAEAPLAPLLELQGFYESVAAQGLNAIPVRRPAQ